jgi:hypothetical protein
MRCDQCKYWEAPKADEWEPVRKIMGKCNRAPHVDDMAAWSSEDAETGRYILPEYADRTAATIDFEEYNSGLICKAEHFCAMFAGKESA